MIYDQQAPLSRTNMPRKFILVKDQNYRNLSRSRSGLSIGRTWASCKRISFSSPLGQTLHLGVVCSAGNMQKLTRFRLHVPMSHPDSHSCRVKGTTLYSPPDEKDLELFHPDQYYLYHVDSEDLRAGLVQDSAVPSATLSAPLSTEPARPNEAPITVATTTTTPSPSTSIPSPATATSNVLSYVALRRCQEDTKESLDKGDDTLQIDVLYM
jgi:hypothetical protein